MPYLKITVKKQWINMFHDNAPNLNATSCVHCETISWASVCWCALIVVRKFHHISPSSSARTCWKSEKILHFHGVKYCMNINIKQLLEHSCQTVSLVFWSNNRCVLLLSWPRNEITTQWNEMKWKKQHCSQPRAHKQQWIFNELANWVNKTYKA